MGETLKKLIAIFNSKCLLDLWSWSGPIHRPIFYVCISDALATIFSLLVTVCTKNLIDGATEHNWSALVTAGVFLLLLVLGVRIINSLNSAITVRARAVLLRSLRQRVLRRLLSREYTKLAKIHSGELVNRIFSDVAVIVDGVMDIVPLLISMVLGFIGAVFILADINFRFVLLLIAGGAVGFFLTVIFRSSLKARHRRVRDAEGKLHAGIQELLENIKTVRSGNAEERLLDSIDGRQGRFYAAQLQRGYFSAIVNGGIGLMFRLSWLACMVYGAMGIYNDTLTYGSMAAIIQLMGWIQSPFSYGANVAGRSYGVISSTERLNELLELPEEAGYLDHGDDSFGDICDSKANLAKVQEIAMQGVSFSYADGKNASEGEITHGKNALREVSFSVQAGDFVAVTGESGSGKSTMFSLLLGLLQPTKGEVYFLIDGGQKLLASRQTRWLCAYVPQGNTLFSGTIRENILLFIEPKRQVSDGELMAAAQIACIDELIEGLEKGLDTVIGERGVGLSEGQAQRIAIARALVSGARILLLDESTSALDSSTEARVLRNIYHMRNEGREPLTCFIVTHRPAALELCDYQLAVADGIVKKQKK